MEKIFDPQQQPSKSDVMIYNTASKDCPDPAIYWQPQLIRLHVAHTPNYFLQTDMMTKAELAFSALDRDNKGYISAKDFKKLTKKLSDQELTGLMEKVEHHLSNNNCPFNRNTSIILQFSRSIQSISSCVGRDQAHHQPNIEFNFKRPVKTVFHAPY